MRVHGDVPVDAAPLIAADAADRSSLVRVACKW